MIKRFKKGFTLVELVIVIAVIAVLAAVLIPTFSDMIKKAQNSADLQEARNLFSEALIEDPTITSETLYIKVGEGDKVGYVKFENGQPKEVTDEEGNVIEKGDYTFDSIPDSDNYIEGSGVFVNIFRNKYLVTGCEHANTEPLPAVEATCTSTGLKEGTRCLDCGTEIVKQQTISKKPHSYVGGVCSVCGAAENNEPEETCEHTTFVNFECSNCKAKHYIHNYGNCNENQYITPEEITNYTYDSEFKRYSCIAENCNGYLELCEGCELCGKIISGDPTECQHTNLANLQNKGTYHKSVCTNCYTDVIENHTFENDSCICGAENVVTLTCQTPKCSTYVITMENYYSLVTNSKYTVDDSIKCPLYKTDLPNHICNVQAGTTVEISTYEYVCENYSLGKCSNNSTVTFTRLERDYQRLIGNLSVFGIPNCDECKQTMVEPSSIPADLDVNYHWECTNPLCDFYIDLLKVNSINYFGKFTVTNCPNCLQNTLTQGYSHDNEGCESYDINVKNVYKCINNKHDAIEISPRDYIEGNWYSNNKTYIISKRVNTPECGILCGCDSGTTDKKVFSKELHLICDVCKKNVFTLYDDVSKYYAENNGVLKSIVCGLDSEEGHVLRVCYTRSCGEHTLTEHEHDTAETSIIIPATCTENGSIQTICKNCYHVFPIQTIEKLGHTWVTTPEKAATCTEGGLSEGKYCSTCNEVQQQQVPTEALGHKQKNNSCECEYCKEKLYHNVQAIPEKAATCIEEGSTGGTRCNRCFEIIEAATVYF